MFIRKLLVVCAAMFTLITPAMAQEANANAGAAASGKASSTLDAGNPLNLGAASIGGAPGVVTTVIGPFGHSRPDTCEQAKNNIAFLREFGSPLSPTSVRKVMAEKCHIKVVVTRAPTYHKSSKDQSRSKPAQVVSSKAQPFEPVTVRAAGKKLVFTSAAKLAAFNDCNVGVLVSGTRICASN